MAALWVGRIWPKSVASGVFWLLSVSVASENSGMVWLLLMVRGLGFQPTFAVDKLLAIRCLFEGAESVGSNHLHAIRRCIHQTVQGRQQIRKTVAGNKTVQAPVRSEEHTSELQSRPHLV